VVTKDGEAANPPFSPIEYYIMLLIRQMISNNKPTFEASKRSSCDSNTVKLPTPFTDNLIFYKERILEAGARNSYLDLCR